MFYLSPCINIIGSTISYETRTNEIRSNLTKTVFYIFYNYIFIDAIFLLYDILKMDFLLEKNIIERLQIRCTLTLYGIVETDLC